MAIHVKATATHQGSAFARRCLAWIALPMMACGGASGRPDGELEVEGDTVFAGTLGSDSEGPWGEAGSGGGAAGGEAGGGGSGTATSGATQASATETAGVTGGGESTSGGTAGGTTSETASTTGSTVGTTTAGAGTACGGKIFACADGLDNDDDGRVDLDDPECTGPCDNDERSFQTGVPGDNMDCKQDCFFDGNSGSGDDGCSWNLKCDPEDPGANIGCGYTGGQSCNGAAAPSEACQNFCEAFVPNGCDCFGCCEVRSGNTIQHIFLNSSPDCSLSNLGACQSCTPQTECSNTCDAEGCEVCFGQAAPAEGCTEINCGGGTSCATASDCGGGFFCQTGCCVPVPQ